MGNLLDDFLEIDAIIEDIIFYGFADHNLHSVTETAPSWGYYRRKNESLVAPGSLTRLAYFTNVCLGRLEWYNFSQNSDVASSSKWKNDALSMSISPRGLVAWMLVFHLEVTGSIPAASIFFPTGLTILALLSSSWTNNKFYSMLLAGIFPAKQTQQKVMECSKIKMKSHSCSWHYYGNPYLTTFLWQALECSEISSPILRIHRKTPSKPIIFSCWVP